MEIVNIEQGTPEWFKVRQLKMTASHANTIATAGKGLETYITELIAEHFTYAEYNPLKTFDMQRGNDLEEQARVVYELENGVKVEQVGFVIHNDYVGCSPDGLVGDDGLLEIKSPADKEHIRFAVTQQIQPKYVAQMNMQMLITGRKWCDFVSYNPNFDKSIIIKRIEPDLEIREKLEVGFKKGEALIKEYMDIMND